MEQSIKKEQNEEKVIEVINTLSASYQHNLETNFCDQEAKYEFYKNVHAECSNAHQNITEQKKITDTEKVKIAIAITAFSSVQASQETLKVFFAKADKYTEIVEFCCVLLNLKNWRLIESITSETHKHGMLVAKFKGLKEIIWNQRQRAPKNAKKLIFLHRCAKFLGERQISKKIRHTISMLPPQLKSSNEAWCHLEETPRDQQSLICTDGVINNSNKDPPGQKSVYIPPGDGRKEAYRLSTFLKFPSSVPADPRKLARVGFLYSGYKDRVRCFFCGSSVSNWSMNDDVESQRWHKEECAIVKGEESNNIPLAGGMFSRFQSQSFTSPASSSTTVHSSYNQANAPSSSSSTGTSYQSDDWQTINNIAASSTSAKYHRGADSFSNYRENGAMRLPDNVSNQDVAQATITSSSHEQLVRSLDLKKEENRVKTFRNWQTETVRPSDLARSGFYFLGNLDRVQCITCGGVLRNWRMGDNVEEEHKKHFPNCRMVQAASKRNTMVPPPAGSLLQRHAGRRHCLTDAQKIELLSVFPCRHATNPHMRSEDARFETFDPRWPQHKVNATAREIAIAGFFFLGERDRVKCWYCNGGLQNWEATDVPWTEHAKWFPTCEFLLQSKGPDFVHEIVSQFPNLQRSLFSPPLNSLPGFRRRERSASPVSFVDPQMEMSNLSTKMNEAMQSNIVKHAEEMNFERKKIHSCIKRRLTVEHNNMYTSVEELIEDLLGGNTGSSSSDESDDEMQVSGPSQLFSTTNAAASTSASASFQAEPSTSSYLTESPSLSEPSLPEGASHSLQDRIREMQIERRCKICLERRANVVFIPCGHLSCCLECTPALKNCPICRQKITKAMRIY